MNNRSFLPSYFEISDWDSIKPYLDKLIQFDINSIESYQEWILNRSEIESVISENLAWRYIKMTCNTEDETIQKEYEFFIENIQPFLAPYEDELNKKFLNSPFFKQLNDSSYTNMKRTIEQSVEIFREKNIDLFTSIQLKQANYQAIVGKMSVEFEGKEITLPKAASYLQNTDRAIRKEIWLKINERRIQDKETLTILFDELIALRDAVAQNANYQDFREYSFDALCRFDYTPKECYNFHDAIFAEVMPIVNDITLEKKQQLGYDTLKPWDLKVDPKGQKPLKPFQSASELLTKTINCFSKIKPELASYLQTMKELNHFDLASRKGKAPGGYNYPLEETGIPFIFMNATDTLRDLVTMVHEGGHAVHSFKTKELPVNYFRNTPSEIAELASMSMELISMEHWEEFFDNPTEIKRAKIEHLEDILLGLPWIATIDAFQHWLYTNPTHTHLEREQKWLELSKKYSDKYTDWSEIKKYKNHSWQRQLHLYEVPFYYIEYGIAQLGAISIWKNYKKNPEKTLDAYLEALSLGYTKSMKEIYQTAGIEFNFSKNYIAELMDFVKEELKELKK